MNESLRRTAVIGLALFAVLMLNANWVQFFGAGKYLDNPNNHIRVYKAYAKERGQILAGDQAVAVSAPNPNPDSKLKYIRSYPQGPLYAPVTGYASNPLALGGLTGLESAENDVLNGTAGSFFVRNVLDILTGRKPQGGSVKTTINTSAQQAAFNAMQGKTGAVVAIDPTTGAILAMVSLPSYDPNPIASPNRSTAFAAYNALHPTSPDSALINRVIFARYPPGSTFKVVTAAAALSNDPGLGPDSTVSAPSPLPLGGNNTLENEAGLACSETMTLTDALANSCNTIFGKLGIDLGADKLTGQAQAFGIGQDLQVPMKVTPSVVTTQPLGRDRGLLARTAIGQQDVQITPLQAAMIAAGVANNGKVMKPYLVEEIHGPDLSVIDKTSPEVLGRAVSPHVARELTTMMIGVVQNGTGKNAQIPGAVVGGKTGTAQHGEKNVGPPYAWFIGFAQAGDKQVAVAVVIESSSVGRDEISGGGLAAPVAQAVMRAVLGL